MSGARENGGAPLHYVELVTDRLYALSNAYEIDGQVSWHPPGLRGFAPVNAYLLREAEEDLLIDTGVTAHRAQMLAGLRELGVGERPLSILALRPGEFDSICNLAPIIRAFRVRSYYSYHPDGLFWGEQDPNFPFDLERDSTITAPDLVATNELDAIELGGAGERRIPILHPQLRLLYTNWLYDETTRTLFTSDSFSWVIRSPEQAGRGWVVRADEDDASAEQIREHLLGSRYWWLRSADLTGIRADLAKTFNELKVDRIAPAAGCIIEGPSLVEKHVELLDGVLAEEEDRPAGVHEARSVKHA